MEIHEPCSMIWSLTPGYPVLLTWKDRVFTQEKCPRPKVCERGIIYQCSGRAQLLHAGMGCACLVGKPCAGLGETMLSLVHRGTGGT